MPTLFLDTHMWSYLVESKKYSDDQLRQARERLVEGVKRGDWEIVCSLPVLQEIIRVYRNDPQKYEAIKGLVFKTVGHRWLLDLKQRYVAELYNGGLLLPPGIYINREKRKQIERLANNKKDVIDVGDITYKEGLDFKAGQEDARKKVFADLGSADGKAPKKIAQAYEKWFANDRDLEGWVLNVLEGGVARKLFPAAKLKEFAPTEANSPSTWEYVDFRQAKVLLELGYGRAIKESDGIDADMYGCSPYYGILVTDDKGLRETASHVVNGKFELYGFEQLMQMLGIK
ncbi:MAG: hypothetical protein AAB834_04165 [Patescibacteria group bacterium]